MMQFLVCPIVFVGARLVRVEAHPEGDPLPSAPSEEYVLPSRVFPLPSAPPEEYVLSAPEVYHLSAPDFEAYNAPEAYQPGAKVERYPSLGKNVRETRYPSLSRTEGDVGERGEEDLEGASETIASVKTNSVKSNSDHAPPLSEKMNPPLSEKMNPPLSEKMTSAKMKSNAVKKNSVKVKKNSDHAPPLSEKMTSAKMKSNAVTKSWWRWGKSPKVGSTVSAHKREMNGLKSTKAEPGAILSLLLGDQVKVRYDAGATQTIPLGWVKKSTKPVACEVGSRVEAYVSGCQLRTGKPGDQTKFGDQTFPAVVLKITGGMVKARFDEGAEYTIPLGWVKKSTKPVACEVGDEVKTYYIIKGGEKSGEAERAVVLSVPDEGHVRVHFNDGTKQIVPLGWVKKSTKRKK